MTPSSVYQLSRANFRSIVDKLDEDIRQKLFFNFMSILSPQKLGEAQQEILDSFRKRNNPDEEDEPLMDEDVAS